MNRVTRISGTGFPHSPRRPKVTADKAHASTNDKPKLVDPPLRRATDRRVPYRQGPTAPFLTQYVDQHWHWPRDPNARVRARQTAASAYGATDGLDTEAPMPPAITRKA